MQTREEVRQQVQEQVREAVRAARDAAREAARERGDAAVEAREAAIQAREAALAALEGEVGAIQQGTTLQPTFPPGLNGEMIREISQDAMYGFFATVAVIIIGLPLARAFARWIDRRGHTPSIPADVGARLERIEQAVESIAIEVERVSESQRFASKLLAESHGVPAGTPAWQSPRREPLPIPVAGKE